MTTQMIIRLDSELKTKVSSLAKKDGKTTSQVIRELITSYIKDRDISSYVDDLWSRSGKKIRSQGIKPIDINKIIKSVRSKKK